MQRAFDVPSRYTLVLSSLLLLMLLPVLDLFTHPVSVMYGKYVPLIVRLSDVYSRTALLGLSLIAAPVLLIVLLVLAQSKHWSFLHSAAAVVAPFLVAVVLQYFIAVGLDKYIVEWWLGGAAIPWEYIFQLSFMLACLKLLVVYSSIAALLGAVLFIARRIVTRKA